MARCQCKAHVTRKEFEATQNVSTPHTEALGYRFLIFCSALSHPLVDPRSNSICLITKDPQREYKDLLEAKGVKFVSRVVGVTKLRGKFKPYEARRQLLNEHGLFLADDRVVPMLPNLLGKMFFDAKK